MRAKIKIHMVKTHAQTHNKSLGMDALTRARQLNRYMA